MNQVVRFVHPFCCFVVNYFTRLMTTLGLVSDF